MKKRLTLEEFTMRGKTLHNGKFDYSKFIYTNAHTKSIITCKICNKEFLQNPCNHMNGKGCPFCSPTNRRMNTSQFIRDAIKKHSGKYDYTKFKYINSNTKGTIFCKKCRRYFEQVPKNHLVGRGCPFCVGKHMNTDVFIERAKCLHNNKYDYTKFKYINSTTKGTIFCKRCGKDFDQIPSSHLQGAGCPLCSHTKTQEEFILESVQRHGSRYDYSETIYIKTTENVTIICKECNRKFQQKASAHLFGKGCPHCTISGGENLIETWLTDRNIHFIPQMKFDSCRNKNKLSFDFFIPSHKILIEYDGEQHYNPIDFFGGIKQLTYIKMLDNIKNEWAKQNRYNLIRIKYDMKSKDVFTLLETLLV